MPRAISDIAEVANAIIGSIALVKVTQLASLYSLGIINKRPVEELSFEWGAEKSKTPHYNKEHSWQRR